MVSLFMLPNKNESRSSKQEDFSELLTLSILEIRGFWKRTAMAKMLKECGVYCQKEKKYTKISVFK